MKEDYSDDEVDTTDEDLTDNKVENEDKYKIKCFSTNKESIYQPRASQIDLLPKLPTGIIVVGRSGSGKTLAVMNMLTNENLLADTFDFIYMYVGVKPDPELIKVLNLPKENIKLDFTEEEIDNLMRKMEKTVEKQGMKNTPSVLMIFDDILGRDKFLKSKTMTKLVTTNRHMNISYIIMSQYFRKLPSVVRTNASYLMIFPSSMIELEKLAEEQTPPNLTKKQFIKIAQHATSEKYSFLSINTKCSCDKQLRKGFDKILTLN